MQKIEIDGNNFSNLAEFYDEIELKLTSGLNWKIGRNLNAFDDVLDGGFGVHELNENLELIWLNSEKSKSDLGWNETILFISEKLKNCHPTNKLDVELDLEKAKSKKGQTLYEIITDLINAKPNIKLAEK
jgi:RNAse (barnase) inhibitor barstar